MKRLIVNADDFGLTDGCNEGIIKAMKDGVVRATTIMINMSKAQDAIKLVKENGIEGLGLHLTLTCGSPISSLDKVPTLIADEKRFYRRRGELLPVMNLKEVEFELRNQIETFLGSGLTLTHLDSHHHIHSDDGVRGVVIKLAKEYDLPLRQPNSQVKEEINREGVMTTDHFSMDFYGEGANVENLKKIINSFEGGTIEIMTHPAIADEELKEISSYNEQRERELEVLTSTELKKYLDDKEIELIGFMELRD
ncbi:chitin disaccharide deacetylase [Halonatronum saccharophilum]|uniref:chitin disaccharide deacetylase n=1 Tax=Halonatronum saccharophilum TaxID=150060 RepID=UPI00047FF9CF|nr:chitin disaccharide deacetylase [Halonatronum saccharophilum]